MEPKKLVFTMLSESEKLRYVELVNSCNSRWAEQADEAGEKKCDLVRVVKSGGVSFCVYQMIESYHAGRHILIDARRVGNYLRRLAKRYACAHIATKTFPKYEVWEMWRDGMSTKAMFNALLPDRWAESVYPDDVFE